jgi:hypothetical protein
LDSESDSVADPDQGYSAFDHPNPKYGYSIQDGKKSGSRIQDPRSGINILDHISERLITFFWIKNTGT